MLTEASYLASATCLMWWSLCGMVTPIVSFDSSIYDTSMTFCYWILFTYYFIGLCCSFAHIVEEFRLTGRFRGCFIKTVRISMPPNSRVAKSFHAMKAIGVSEDKVQPVLKNLLRLFDKNWELIEEENYRALADAIFEREEAEVWCSPQKIFIFRSFSFFFFFPLWSHYLSIC